ncbi:unnamed protein product [Angiostrongylus costaricensis]|uniref:Rad60-SLD domain-containing protein n=1 Tax=Angiostrongylus costaricensis TaxID=334426 RepID=A0A158PK47_ANGCS|nr:unnamed protein product [Angiostrongylus costaricensis]
MEYDDDFRIKVYDIGGHERIRDIWTNYFAELQHHRGTASKPFLVVLNKRKPTELDDFDFTISADLNAVGMERGQMIFVTHVNEYKGELDNAKQPPPPVSKKSRRISSPLLTQFCVFVDKIIEHYVFLSEGVQSAEMALKLRQQAERDERRIRLMRQDQERRNSDIAELDRQVKSHLTEEQFTHASSNGDVRHDTTMGLTQEMLRNEQNPTTVEPEPKDNTQKSDSPSVSDTQSPVADSPCQQLWNTSEVSHTPIAPLAQNPLPPLRPNRTKVTPANGKIIFYRSYQLYRLR